MKQCFINGLRSLGGAHAMLGGAPFYEQSVISAFYAPTQRAGNAFSIYICPCPHICPSVRFFFNFVTKVEKWGHSCLIGTLLVLHKTFEFLFHPDGYISGVLGIEQFQLGHDNGGSQDHSRIM